MFFAECARKDDVKVLVLTGTGKGSAPGLQIAFKTLDFALQRGCGGCGFGRQSVAGGHLI